MSASFRESELRDFLAPRVGDLRSMILNADECEQRLAALDDQFIMISAQQGGPTSLELMCRIVGSRSLRGLANLQDLQLLTQPGKANTEFTLLDGGASADILAIAPESSTFFLIELKKSVQTERQAVGELSAYSQGLHNRFWGICSADLVWVPVSTEWNAPVRAAFTHQIISREAAVLPLHASVELDPASSQIVNVQLELLDLVPEIDEPLAAAQFAWDCFDTLAFALADEPAQPSSLIDFITATAARYQFSGFVTYGESLLKDRLPYPYAIVIAIHNPYKAMLKRRQLEMVLKSGSPTPLVDMRRDVKAGIWDLHDIDFRTGKDIESIPDDEEPDQGAYSTDFVSVAEMASASCNRTSALFEQLATRFNLLPGGYELSTPGLRSLVHSDPHHFPPVKNVGYFGLFQEALYERLMWEFRNKSDFGDGPVIGDLCGDATSLAHYPQTLFEFLELMNWEHDSQTDYAEEEHEESNAVIEHEDLVIEDLFRRNAGGTENVGPEEEQS